MRDLRHPSFRRGLLALAICQALACPAAMANPTGGKIVHGTGTIENVDNVLTVTTGTRRSVIDWQTFSIGPDEITRFIQPSSDSSVLNRVLANEPSLLLGRLESNGQVFLINPFGILVGEGAAIDVAGFVASTLDLGLHDYLEGRFRFSGGSSAAPIVNQGRIVTPEGGSIYLVAPEIENSGLLSAPGGEVLLAAGRELRLVDTGTPGVTVVLTGAPGDVTNVGQVLVDAGTVGMAGALVRNSGVVDAGSMVREGGRIFLRATDAVELSGGELRARSAAATGGAIDVTAPLVEVREATLDASGASGGGRIRLGGPRRGGKDGDDSLPTADTLFVSSGSTIRADAEVAGRGGEIILWSDVESVLFPDHQRPRGGRRGRRFRRALVAEPAGLGRASRCGSGRDGAVRSQEHCDRRGRRGPGARPDLRQ